MTCIVGLIKGNKIYMGADRAGVAGMSLSVRADPKVFVRKPFIMGFTTSFRMGQLLQYKLSVPEIGKEQDVFAYMATVFVDAVRACLKAGGFATKKDETESGGEFLVGYAGRLFTVESDYQIAERVTPYAATGCGQGIAMGSLFSTSQMTPKTRIGVALEAAESFSAGVRRPFDILSLGGE